MNNQMMKYLFHILFIYAIIQPRVSARDKLGCDPEVNCKYINEPGSLVIDPDNCHNYYACIEVKQLNGDTTVEPSDNPFTCPKGFKFMPGDPTGECIEEIKSCHNNCVTRNCKAVCSQVEDMQFIADPKDCSKYYTCFHEEKISVDCDPDTFFNGEKCVDDKYQCCKLCEPWCEEQYTEVMDPFDCNYFYLCLEKENVPPSEQRYRCKNGESFDAHLGRCQPNTRCSNLCK